MIRRRPCIVLVAVLALVLSACGGGGSSSGTTEIAVISLAGIVHAESLKIGGDRLDRSIVEHLERKYHLLVGERTAEQIKLRIGSAWTTRDLESMEVKGRDKNHGVPKTAVVHSDEVREALSEPLGEVVRAVRRALEQTPPELSADIVDKGIVITGGGALLPGIDTLIREETGLPVLIADDPVSSVVIGAGKVLDNPDLLREVAIK